MTTSLRPLRPDEYDDLVATVRRGYVHDMVVAGVPEDTAEAKWARDHEAILPHGIETEGHLFFAIDADGERAGFLWVSDREGEFGRSLFVWAIELDEAYRGRGIGRAAMVAAEEEARRRGIGSVMLNVFGGNDVARGLYRSLGYEDLAILMRKTL